MNLCVNARDAMPDGGTLSICAENLFDQNYARMNLDARVGPFIVITVSDTGTGIPPEIVDRILSHFYNQRVGPRYGAYLSTVIGIIKSHGGFVNVTSQQKGTQFQVYLPAVEGTETQQAEDPNCPQDTENSRCRWRTRHSWSYQTTLETYNYKALTASDGIEAIVTVRAA